MFAWVSFYALDLLFCIWVLMWGGADYLQGTLKSGFIISIFAPKWTAEGIKLFVWLTLIFSTIGFIIGLFSPDFRSSF